MPATKPKIHETLVSALTKDLKAVKTKPMRSTFILWLIPSLIITAILTIYLGFDPHLSTHFTQFPFIITIIGLIIATLISGWFAIKMATPGEEPPKKNRIILLTIPILFIIFISVYWISQYSWESYKEGLSGGLPCLIAIVAIAVVPIIYLSILISKLAPMNAFGTALMITLSALFLSALAVQLHCHINNGCHLAIWHYLPIFLGSLFIAIPLQYFLVKWKKTKLNGN